MSKILQMYEQVGPEAFSNLIGETAPYFSTIAPVFHDLRPGLGKL